MRRRSKSARHGRVQWHPMQPRLRPRCIGPSITPELRSADLAIASRSAPRPTLRPRLGGQRTAPRRTAHRLTRQRPVPAIARTGLSCYTEVARATARSGHCPKCVNTVGLFFIIGESATNSKLPTMPKTGNWPLTGSRWWSASRDQFSRRVEPHDLWYHSGVVEQDSIAAHAAIVTDRRVPTDTPSPTPQPTSTALPGSATQGVELCAGPGMNYGTAGGLTAGEMVEIVGQTSDGEWYCVRPRSGDLAWVSAAYIAAEAGSAAIPTVDPGAIPATPVPTNTRVAPLAPAPTNTALPQLVNTPRPVCDCSGDH
jgi:hypothetical protein